MKYRLTENTVEYKGKTLYQIEALKDFEVKREHWVLSVKKGDLGGYIEKESNLSQQGNCWITPNVYVFDNAKVENDAFINCICKVRENSRVFGRVWLLDDHIKTYESDISGQAKVYGNAYICKAALTMDGNTKIYGDAEVIYTQLSLSDNAIFCGGDISGIDKGHIYLRDNAEMRGGRLSDNCLVYGNAIIYGGCISDNSEIYGNAKIYDSDICGEAKVAGNTEVKFDTNIGGNAYLCGNAIVERDEDVMTFSNIGTLALLQNEEIEDMKHLTFFRAGDKMQMTIGNRFYDDPEKFLQHTKLFCQNLQAMLEMAEQRFGYSEKF
ncbi:hypothetical protein [Mannheimia indoligenes]|uniref:hypothetical protein n=1 Tax=Mannheimia indoligenes TaxID=3103145 RepID=UPI002FE549CC